LVEDGPLNSSVLQLFPYGDEKFEFVAAFESTYLPGHGVDVTDTTGHSSYWRADIDRAAKAGVTAMRYPLLWHRIESEPGRFDWSEADAVLSHLRERAIAPILDLVHHTSYPEWLGDGFRDRRFPAAYQRFAEAVAVRYPWLPGYTLFNEPFATLFLAGHEALWPPYDRGMEGFVRLLRNVLPAISAASECWSELLPQAQHVWFDTCENHRGSSGSPQEYARLANDRRHVVLDLALGRHLDPERPFLSRLLQAGGEPLLDLAPVRVDVLGLDYYCHSEWWYDERGSHAPSPFPSGFAELAEHYGRRYVLPLVLGETNLRGQPTDRASWLRYMLEQCEIARSRGVALQAFCWFPFVDSCDWDSLLARPAGRVDPVGVLGLGADGVREETAFTSAWAAAAAGAPSSALPAYRFQVPCDSQLSGFLPHLRHWIWQDPPPAWLEPAIEIREARDAAGINGDQFTHADSSSDVTVRETTRTMDHNAMTDNPSTITEEPITTTGNAAGAPLPDLVVLSHLRWVWVWQRPQHLVSRFAALRARYGAGTWFVEEPVSADVTEPRLCTEARDDVIRVWLEVPRRDGLDEPVGFDAAGQHGYGSLLAAHLAAAGRSRPDVLLYTPMALDIAEELAPRRLFYDVMDDLASFQGAPPGLVLRQRRALSEASVVFAGGRSLYRSVCQYRKRPSYLFPSGVETAHYAGSRQLRKPQERRIAGYVGVIDERIDLQLLADLAAQLPDWTIRVVGPVTKIDAADLPQAPNLEYPGMARYEDLPAVMATFDVALMPFAINAATRSISPTKTLEYLAAGLPVVSTRVPDVVADYQNIVHLADDAAEFASACRQVVKHSRVERDERLGAISHRHEWDTIATSMAALMSSPAATHAHAGTVA
jgi:glycosyltransferase involved in cell wall biosynthesis/beta-glucosidase/6-phospho-beta-glucosidase/beta-galactosidase